VLKMNCVMNIGRSHSGYTSEVLPVRRRKTNRVFVEPLPGAHGALHSVRGAE
jgi:hypothetical protein